MSAELVRSHYKVPAKRGGRVTVDGRPGRIVGFKRARLRVRFDDTGIVLDAHPTWRVDYLDAPQAEAAR